MPSAFGTRLRRALPRLTRRRLVAGGLVLLVLLGLAGWAAWPSRPGYRTSDATLTVQTGPDGNTPVTLDTRYYQPRSADAHHRVPAVLLAHGFGGDKLSVAKDAEDLANLGYAVLTWTAQGFGASGGQIHLDNPDWEVRDGQRLLDWLAARPEIRTDAPGDPRVAVVGGSYGGGLALLLAGYDQRVDAIIPQITWNDLARDFLPSADGADPADGVFKKGWAGAFFGESAGIGGDPTCGRFAADVCQAYQSIAASGRGNAEAVALLRRSSPATILDRIQAPTLLIQGEADSLFPLAEADANARGIAAHGTPVRVAWFTGGHDGGQSSSGTSNDQDRLRYLEAQWLHHYLDGKGSAPDNSFTYSRIAGIDANSNGFVALGFSVTDYPGVTGNASTGVQVAGPPQQIANPPGGNPAALSVLPGLGSGLGALGGRATTEIGGQHADFVSEPLASAVDVVGSPTVQILAASPTGEVVVFVKLYDLAGESDLTLPNGLVAPVRLTGLPSDIREAKPVTVTLPAIVHEFQAGHRLLVTVASTDQGFATPSQPTVYTVGLGSGTGATVTLPTVHGTPIASRAVVWRYVLAGAVALVALGIVAAVLIARRRAGRKVRTVRDGYADIPLVVKGLRKVYGDFVAVANVDFEVHRGQVVGLLGPNGAGKTTSLRVLMGLTRPDAGEILIFGHPLTPGSAVLSRLGALVEGPGFLPHLSGLANLRLFWRATGRPFADAHFDEAVEIAGLGAAVHRRVKNYSHGMKQRLAIAQAMLGLPELLVLDEPTDGLDPPQIAAMREVLRRYATGGRAVLVSSHLLAEVEQTCTHVVVVHKGEVVASGRVDEIVGDSPTVRFDVSDVDTARTVLTAIPGVRSVVTGDGGEGLVVDLDGTGRAEAVAALVNAGVGVDRVAPRRRLEDAFLSLVGGDTKASGER